MDIQEIADLWKKDEPKYNELGAIVSNFIKSKITEIEILPEISARTKDLLSIIKKVKKKIREKEYSYTHLNDKLGIRIICTFQSEMDNIDEFLYKYFEIINVEKKKDNLDVKTLDYISNHYDAKLKTSVKEFKNHKNLADLIFEIQVRTLNQHAWANTAHTLAYKQEAELPTSLMRKVYRLLSLYEIADDEFSIVNKVLIENADTKVYGVLRKLESKIYRYAKIDFDRETSLFVIRKVLNYLSMSQIKTVSTEIEKFVQSHNKKIEKIFERNRNRFFEIPILSQPEIFLLWFCLEKFPSTITDNWNADKEFDDEELEQIKTLWGKEI